MPSPTPTDPQIFHITDVANLAGILADGGLHSDAVMAQRGHQIIGYTHIKERRLKELQVACCSNRFVGEFVPFYFAPRSPMLYTINRGCTGRPAGCQRTIIHLTSKVSTAIANASAWSFSDGNAGASHALFFKDLAQLERLDWSAIRASSWQGRTHQKSAEFLVADFFPWHAIESIGCHNAEVADTVHALLEGHDHRPEVVVKPGWYY